MSFFPSAIRVPSLVGAVATALLGASPTSAACVLKKLAELPVTMDDLRPTVPAKIEGRTVRMLADTGAFFSMISPSEAAAMKLPLHPAPFGLFVSGVGGAMNTSVTTVKDFALDTIPIHHVDFIVGGSETGPGIDGVIGRNLLTGVDTEYDLANGVIRLMRPAGCLGRSLAYWPSASPASTVSMVIDDTINDNHPEIVVFVTINGETLRATLDTGASNTVVWKSAAARAGIPVTELNTADSGLGGGVGRRLVRETVAPVRSFKIGDEEIKNTRISVADTSVEGSDMLLGADFFLAHRVYISTSQHKVYFTYSGGPVFNLIAKPLDSLVANGQATTAAATDTPKPEPAKPGALEPTDAAGFSRRGEAFAGRRDYPRAMADLDRAVAMAPENADYVYQRATIRLANGQVFLAMADIEQTLKLRPGDPDALVTRAELRFMGHDRAAGLTDLDTVAMLVPTAADVRLRLAGLYDRADKFADAIAQYNLWIPAHPDDNRRAQALNGRCWARGILGQDLDKALADCDAAHRTIPRNASFLDSRGLVRLRLGQFDKAIADYDASLAIQPKSAWSLYGRGLAKLGAGDPVGGKADLAAAVAINSKITDQAAKYGLKPPPT